jgi:phosphotransferase system enzyme I (PtsI)
MITYVGKPALTKDNIQFHLFANIGSVEEADTAIKNGADGIGLLRTEFLFMQAQDRNEILTEQTQFEFYKQILQKMGDKPVTMRTLDAGGDKVIHGMDDSTFQEKNPLLGNRAIRFCLSRPDIFKTQLRALFRASIYGNLQILFPLISTVEQYYEIQKIVREVKISLKADELEFKPDIPLGIMIETPSAAVCADLFAPLCDFFSIGTNDLTQYTLAVDRENLAVASLFNEVCPCVVRLIKNTVEAANKFKIPVTVCGEFASRKEGIKVLGGLGIRNLSMTPIKINESKELLSLLTKTDMEKQVQDYL